MNYRKLGATGKTVSALGFGAMRLPTLRSEAEVDLPASVELIRNAVDHGVNYIDTAYVYHAGAAEAVVGKALEDGYREKVLVATKLPVWRVETRSDCDRILDEQLTRLQTDHVDVYLLHNLQATTWTKMRDLGVLKWAEDAKADGRIGHFGFSFHDSLEVFKQIVDAHDWSLCQIQYNFAGPEVQAGFEGLRYAAAKGLGVVIMEPLFGGALADPPPEVREIWDRHDGRYRAADSALRWLWNQPEVSLVLSGMNRLDHLRENVASADNSGVGLMGEEELDVIRRAREKYAELSPVACTKCGYCSPCPAGVDIPVNLELLNMATVLSGNLRLCRALYKSLPDSRRAAACRRCGTCEERCPQGLPIGESMERVAGELG